MQAVLIVTFMVMFCMFWWVVKLQGSRTHNKAHVAWLQNTTRQAEKRTQRHTIGQHKIKNTIMRWPKCLWKERKNNTETQHAHACWDKDHNNTSKKATEHNTTKNTKNQNTTTQGSRCLWRTPCDESSHPSCQGRPGIAHLRHYFIMIVLTIIINI